MARITVEDCLEKLPNRFALVMLVAKRAKQLVKGSQLTVPASDNKYIVQALREVAAGQVIYEYEEAVSPDQQIESDLNR